MEAGSVCACVGDVYLWFGLIHSGLEQQASIMSHCFQTYVCCSGIHKSSHSVIVDSKKESEHTETFSQFLLRVLNFHCFSPWPFSTSLFSETYPERFIRCPSTLSALFPYLVSQNFPSCRVFPFSWNHCTTTCLSFPFTFFRPPHCALSSLAISS